MDREYKILGQAAPANTSNVTLFTVPTGKYAIISLLNILNQDATVGNDAGTYRVAVVPSGDTLAAKHWLKYDDFLDLRQSRSLFAGLSMAAGDAIIVQAGTVNFSFTLSGLLATVT